MGAASTDAADPQMPQQLLQQIGMSSGVANDRRRRASRRPLRWPLSLVLAVTQTCTASSGRRGRDRRLHGAAGSSKGISP